MLTPGRIERAFRWSNKAWVINCSRVGTRFEPSAEVVRPPDAVGTVATQGLVEVFDPETLPEPFRSLPPIRGCGRVQRLRNPDLWDALLPPILQYRSRTFERVRRYRRLCSAYGETIPTARSAVPLPPRPETVRDFDDAAFGRIGVPLHLADRLRTVANEFVDRTDFWLTLPPAELFDALQDVSYVGKWTAAAATADLTNDFSFYPRSDFTTAGRWEQFTQESEGRLTAYDFECAWQSMCQEQKSTLTALSVDWKTRHPYRRDEVTISSPEQGAEGERQPFTDIWPLFTRH